MNITKVTYQKAFVIGPYLQEKIGIEIDIDSGNGETPEHALDKAKQIVEQWNKANNSVIPEGSQAAPPAELPVINKAEERLGILIDNASSVEELMKYKNELTTPYLANLWSARLQNLKQ